MARTGGSSSRRVYSFLALSSLPLLALAQCECGYIVEGNRFTHGIVTDFSKFPDTSDIMDGSDKELDEWEVQEWGTSVTGQHGNTEYRLPRQNMGENVWIKGGTLHMRQNGYSVQEAEEELPVKVAEIVTRRNDILYGSFRSNFRVIEQPDAEGGSVAGFFFYFNDEAETDIEIRTRDNFTTIHYSQQPTYDVKNDFFYENASITDRLEKPWTEFQEHRWDWHSGKSVFFQNGDPAQILRNKVPNHKGTIMVNLWADGGQWSGPPSTKDVELEVQYFHLYFNISSEEGTAEYLEACEKAGGLASLEATCDVNQGEGKLHTGDELGEAERLYSSSWWGRMCVLGMGAVVGGIWLGL